MKPEDFLQIIRPDANPVSTFRIGSIPATYTSGRPTVKFEGESIASIRTYPYAGSYTPAANDKVLVAMVGHSGVVLCKII